MEKYLQQAMKIATGIASAREELRAARMESIQTGAVPGQTQVIEGGFAFMANFGEMFPYHAYDRRDDTQLRATMQSFWRMRAEESIYACRALMAKLMAQSARDEFKIEEIRFPDEEEIIEDVIAQSDALVFGDQHVRLPTEAEFDALFPDGKSPLTHGFFVEITLYGELYTAEKGFGLKSYISVGNWLPNGKNDLLHRNSYYCTLKEDPDTAA